MGKFNEGMIIGILLGNSNTDTKKRLIIDALKDIGETMPYTSTWNEVKLKIQGLYVSGKIASCAEIVKYFDISKVGNVTSQTDLSFLDSAADTNISENVSYINVTANKNIVETCSVELTIPS